jgi:biotin transport system substrate-specific component
MTPARNDNALALALWPESINTAVKAVVLVIAGSLILTLSAKVSVPFWPVPMTLQTFAVMAIAAAYGSRLAVATVLLYLAQGLAGLPVFAVGAVTGPAYFLGPTAGFLIGFIPLAFIVGLAADRGWSRSVPKLFAAMVVADIVVFVMGFVWLSWFAHLSTGAVGVGPQRAFAGAIQPFILADLVKIALAAFAIPAGWRIVDSMRGAN